MRLQDPDAMMAGKGTTDVPHAARKNLETQHWLELIDGCVLYCFPYWATDSWFTT